MLRGAKRGLGIGLALMLGAISADGAPASGSDVAARVAGKVWFAGLTEHQQAWLLTQIRSGLGGDLPQTASFYSQRPELVLYRSSKLETEIFRGPPAPHAVEAGKDDWGADLGTLTILQREGPALRVEVAGEGEERRGGWIHRSAIRLDSLVLARADGTYLGDLIPAFQAGGSRARLALRARRGRLFLAVRYVKSYQEEDERWFAFEVAASDAAAGGVTLMDVFPWPEGAIETLVEGTLAQLPESTVKALDGAVGLGATGFIRHRDGRMEPGQRFFSAWDASRAAASTDELLLLDSSFYSNTSPTRP